MDMADSVLHPSIWKKEPQNSFTEPKNVIVVESNTIVSPKPSDRCTKGWITITSRSSPRQPQDVSRAFWLCSLAQPEPEELQTLRPLILSSNHAPLSSLMESVVQPLLEELYVGCLSNGIYTNFYSIGQAWFHIVILRLQLLLNPDGHDPVVKNALKYSWILQRKSLLELEKKVCQKFELLFRRSHTEVDEKIRGFQEKLVMEEKRRNFSADHSSRYER